MKINEIVIEGAESNYKKQQELSHKQYRKLVTKLKSSGTGGNKLAKKALRDLMKSWKKGDKAIGNYKKILKDHQIDLTI